MNIKKVKPLFDTVIITADTYTKEDIDNLELIDGTIEEGQLKIYQKVVAVGTVVKDVKEGDLIVFSPERFGIKKHKEGSLKDGIITDNVIIDYKFNYILLDNIPHIVISSRDIEYIIEDYD